jgi:hypothetical protein
MPLTTDQIQSLLPPIVLSVGAILPFLVSSPPFSVQERARVLLLCLMTLVIWLGYWLAYAFGDRPFFSLELTGGLVLLALIMLLIIFFIAQQPAKVAVDDKGNQKVDDNGKPLRIASIDRPIWLWIYLGALFLLSVAAAFYIGPKDRIIVQIELDPNLVLSHSQVSKVEEDAGLAPITVHFSKMQEGAELLLTQGEFKAVKQFLVEVTKPDKSRINLIAYPNSKIELLKPALDNIS